MWSVETIYAGVGFCNLIGWIVGNHIIMKPLKLSAMLKKNTPGKSRHHCGIKLSITTAVNE